MQSRALNIEKNASVTDGTADETSDVITYSYTLTNTGNAAICQRGRGRPVHHRRGPGARRRVHLRRHRGRQARRGRDLDLRRQPTVTQASSMPVPTSSTSSPPRAMTPRAEPTMRRSSRAEQGPEHREERLGDRRHGRRDLRRHHLQIHADQHRQRGDLRRGRGRPGHHREAPVLDGVQVGGDTDSDGQLDVGETWTTPPPRPSPRRCSIRAPTSSTCTVTGDGATGR